MYDSCAQIKEEKTLQNKALNSQCRDFPPRCSLSCSNPVNLKDSPRSDTRNSKCYTVKLKPHNPALGTDLSFSTLGASHDEAGVGQVALAVLGAVDEGAAAFDLDAVRLDGGVDGHGVGAFGFLGSAVALNLPTFGVAGEKRTREKDKVGTLT